MKNKLIKGLKSIETRKRFMLGGISLILVILLGVGINIGNTTKVNHLNSISENSSVNQAIELTTNTETFSVPTDNLSIQYRYQNNYKDIDIINNGSVIASLTQKGNEYYITGEMFGHTHKFKDYTKAVNFFYELYSSLCLSDSGVQGDNENQPVQINFVYQNNFHNIKITQDGQTIATLTQTGKNQFEVKGSMLQHIHKFNNEENADNFLYDIYGSMSLSLS